MSDKEDNIDLIQVPKGLDQGSFKKLLPDFFDELRNDFLSLKEASDNKELKKIGMLAHKIKGTSASYRAPAISQHALEVMEHLYAENPDLLHSSIDHLTASIEELIQYANRKYHINYS